MFREEREVNILERLKFNNRVSVQELCQEFGVSESSIRRDLRILQTKGLLVRTYGGGISVKEKNRPYPTDLRKRKFKENKMRIAKKAFSLIEDGEIVIIDGSTTTYYMVPFLRIARNLTVITNSIEIYLEIFENKNIVHHLTGGTLRRDTMNLSGQLTIESLEQFYVDKLFLGVRGIHIEKGITGLVWEEILTKRTMIKRAKQVIVCADSSKINWADRSVIGPLEDMDMLITDQGIAKEEKESLEKRGIKVILA